MRMPRRCWPDTDVRSGLLVAAGFPEHASVRHAASVLGSGTLISAPDTVPFALWCAAGQLDDLAEVLWQTVAGWGDRDTTCAIVGGRRVSPGVCHSAARHSPRSTWARCAVGGA